MEIFNGHYPEYGITEDDKIIVIGMNEFEVCPKCGSNSIIEYEDSGSEYEDSDIEHEILYENTCCKCMHNF